MLKPFISNALCLQVFSECSHWTTGDFDDLMSLFQVRACSNMMYYYTLIQPMKYYKFCFKVDLCKVIAAMFDQVNLKRKAAFFRRRAAKHCFNQNNASQAALKYVCLFHFHSFLLFILSFCFLIVANQQVCNNGK